MKLTIPSYSTVHYDTEARRAVVEVQNVKEKRQRAMWGEFRSSNIAVEANGY